MDAVVFLLISLMFASGSVTGDTEPANIIGFIDERLDLVCKLKSQEGKDRTVSRFLTENNTAEKTKLFVSTTWSKDKENYAAKVCDPKHSLYNICLSQVTPYVTAYAAHFVFSKTPSYLNGHKTRCTYPGTLQDNGPVQVIKLQGIIKGYVGGRIEMKCSIPAYGCNESKNVSLKFNNTCTKTFVQLQRVSISQANTTFACMHLNDCGRYHNVCRDHMSSSYLNGSCSVIFVFEKTPAFLNNTYLHCHIKFDNMMDNNHTRHETVIFLQRNDSSVTTAIPVPTVPPGTTLPGATTTTALNPTTSTNETRPPQVSNEKGLSGGKLTVIIIFSVLGGITIIGIGIGTLCYCKYCKQSRDRGNDQPHDIPPEAVELQPEAHIR